MRTTVIASAAAALLLVGVGVVNSHRAARVGNDVAPAPRPVAMESMPPSATELGCHAGWPVVIDGMTTVIVPGPSSNHETVIAWHCVDNQGRHPSLIRALQGSPGVNSQYRATLLRPAGGLAVLSLQSVGSTVDVVAVAASAGSRWSWSGAAVHQLYTRTVAGVYEAGLRRASAQPCNERVLTASVWTPPWWDAGSAGLLRFVNSSSRPCYVRGYPTVAAVDVAGRVQRFSQTLNGPFGGIVSGPEPPFVVLKPGQVATALMESCTAQGTPGQTSPRRPAPATSERVTVALDGFSRSTAFKYRMNLCGLQVHPLTDQYFGPTS